jgi:protein-disulfide isomerase
VSIDSRPAAHRFERRLALLTIAGVGVVVLALIFTQTRSVSPLAQGDEARTIVRLVSNLYDGVPQHGRNLGSARAPVTITLFADLQSPAARKLMLGPLRPLVRQQAALGQVRLRFRSLRRVTPRTRIFLDQQTAALAAARQDRLRQFVALFLRQQGDPGSRYVTDGFLRAVAEQAGLDLDRFNRDRADPQLRRQVKLSVRRGAQLGASQAPVLVVEGPRGRHVTGGVTEADELEAVYDRAWH